MDKNEALAFFNSLIQQIEEDTFGPLTEWTPDEQVLTARIRDLIVTHWDN